MRMAAVLMAQSKDPLDEVAILYFGNDWAAENRTSSHHIAARLISRYRLLYVDSPGLRAPQATARDWRKLWRKLRDTLAPPSPISPRAWRCTVPQIPFRRVPGVSLANRLIATFFLRRHLSHLGFHDVILWFAVPHPGFMVGRLGERFVVYYCIDDYSAHPGVDAVTTQFADLRLTRLANRVFVAPPALVEEKRLLNPSTTYSPHGVDTALFASAQSDELRVADAARALRRPIVGYFGSVAPWLDFQLLEYLAKQRPAYTYLIVGHVSADVAALRALPNVHFVGPQPYSDLPKWAKAFDAAVIPYSLNQQVQNCNPLKLREYLATGKPVVTVRAPEVDRFERVLRIADTHEQFLEHLDSVILHPDPALVSRQIDAVRDQTWDRRVDEVLEVLRSDLDARGCGV